MLNGEKNTREEPPFRPYPAVCLATNERPPRETAAPHLAKQDLPRSAVLRAKWGAAVSWGVYPSSFSASILLKALGLPEPLAAFMH